MRNLPPYFSLEDRIGQSFQLERELALDDADIDRSGMEMLPTDESRRQSEMLYDCRFTLNTGARRLHQRLYICLGPLLRSPGILAESSAQRNCGRQQQPYSGLFRFVLLGNPVNRQFPIWSCK